MISDVASFLMARVLETFLSVWQCFELSHPLTRVPNKTQLRHRGIASKQNEYPHAGRKLTLLRIDWLPEFER